MKFHRCKIFFQACLSELVQFGLVLIAFMVNYGVFIAQDTQRDKLLGEEANEQLGASIGFYEHESSKYLDDLGQRLVSSIDDQLFTYQFGILDMEEPNALALPGGYIYFSRGLLALVNSEDQLAGVMGHEIMHVHRRHSIKAQNKSIFTGILQIPGAIVGAFSPDVGGLLMAPFAMMDAGYSRSQENDADKFGVRLAAQSGYDPNGLIEILASLSEAEQLITGKKHQPGFLDTHPNTPKRLKVISKTIDKISVGGSEDPLKSRKEMLAQLEGIIIGSNPAQGVVVEEQFLHPDLNLSFWIPKDWISQNTPKALALVAPDEKAQLIFTGEKNALPKVLAEEFIESMYKKYRIKPANKDSLNDKLVNRFWVKYVHQDNGKQVVFQKMWMRIHEQTYQLTSISIPAYEDVFLKMGRSLTDLSGEDRKKVMKTEMRLVSAHKDETLEELSTRTGNTLDLDYLYLINSLDKGYKMIGNEIIKIGIKTPY
jgi:predicted Zn-dependent protease